MGGGNFSAGDWMRLGGIAATAAGAPEAGGILSSGAGGADLYGMAKQDKAFEAATKRQAYPYVISPEQQAKDVELVKNYPSAEARQKRREEIITRTGQSTAGVAEGAAKRRAAQRQESLAALRSPLSLPQGGPVSAGQGGAILRPQPSGQQPSLTALAQLLTRRNLSPADFGGGF